jgi:ABC-type sugar transport system substrate-binding protein
MRTLTRIFLALTAGCLMAALAGTGCSKAAAPSASGTAAAKRTIRIGMIAKSESNDVFQAAHTGAVDAAQ